MNRLDVTGKRMHQNPGQGSCMTELRLASISCHEAVAIKGDGHDQNLKFPSALACDPLAQLVNSRFPLLVV